MNRWITATLVNSDASRASVVKQFGLKADSVALIPNGIDLAKFASNPDRILLNRPIKIGMMANLRKIKQIDLLVQALTNYAKFQSWSLSSLEKVNVDRTSKV